MTKITSESELDAYWTPDTVREMVRSLGAAIDAVPRGPGMEQAFRKASVKLDSDLRRRLLTELQIIAVAVAHFEAMVGWGETPLLGAAADKCNLLNLLSALDPAKLSNDVVDQLSNEMGGHFGGWTALPRPLFNAFVARCEEQDDAHAEVDEPEEKAR